MIKDYRLMMKTDTTGTLYHAVPVSFLSFYQAVFNGT